MFFACLKTSFKNSVMLSLLKIFFEGHTFPFIFSTCFSNPPPNNWHVNGLIFDFFLNYSPGVFIFNNSSFVISCGTICYWYKDGRGKVGEGKVDRHQKRDGIVYFIELKAYWFWIGWTILLNSKFKVCAYKNIKKFTRFQKIKTDEILRCFKLTSKLVTD